MTKFSHNLCKSDIQISNDRKRESLKKWKICGVVRRLRRKVLLFSSTSLDFQEREIKTLEFA